MRELVPFCVHHPTPRHSPLCSDATIGLATMNLEPETWQNKSLKDLSASEVDTLESWVQRFSGKYKLIGYLNDGAHPRSTATNGQ